MPQVAPKKETGHRVSIQTQNLFSLSSQAFQAQTMSPPSPVPPWVQWSNELAREMYIKRALNWLQLQYPDDS